jgi:magnesium transporter
MPDTRAESDRPDDAEHESPSEALRASPADGIDSDSTGADEQLALRIEDIHATEGAEVLQALSPQDAADVAEALDPNTAADILSEMEPTDAAAVVADMETPEASVVLSAMDPDDRVDVLERLEPEKREELVSDLPADDAEEVRKLSSYPPDTAGGLMTTDVTALHEELTIQQAIDELRRLRERHEQLFYSYVVDSRRHLIGVLSMRDLIFADPHKKVREIMIPNVRALQAATDQEEVARLFKKLNYLAMPVIDERGRLMGIVTVDDVVDVMEREATEDMQKFFGAGAEERLSSPWHYSFKARTWWLIVNLATAFLAGWVVSLFDDIIAKLAVLAVYMPIVAGMGGNASAQAMAVAIRGLAVGESGKQIVQKVLAKEALVGLLTGVVCGLITAAVALLWQKNPALGAIVAAALIINHTLACFSGAGIPFIMKRLGYDPAQSATIFATTVTDVAGFFSLLGLAWLFQHYLVP